MVGITNMHELALGITSENASYGPVPLPWDKSRSAGGSSGGSAAAVASGAVDFALGTDTGGSISIPASHCGVVGFRPSTGRWPGDGIVGLSWTRDTPGIFTRSVGDAAKIDSWITGSYQRRKERSRPRLGVPRELIADLSLETHHAFARALVQLSDSAELVDVTFERALNKTRRAEAPLVGWESRRELGQAASQALGLDPEAAFRALVDGVESADVVELLDRELTSPITAEQYTSAQQDTIAAQAAAVDLFSSERLDALVFPTTPAPAPLIGTGPFIEHLGRRESTFGLYTRNTGPGTIVGAPMVTLPIASPSASTQVGLTLQGMRHHDEDLLSHADALHQYLCDG